jgi:hypothetical protein
MRKGVAHPARSRWCSPTPSPSPPRPRRSLAGPLPTDDREAAALPRLLVRDGGVPRAERAGDERVAVLPWHLYQPLRATEGRLAANPAQVFFPGSLTAPNNLEIPGRATEVVTRYDRLGLTGTSPCALARTLRGLGIRWALVLDGGDARRRCRGFALVAIHSSEGRPGFTGVLRDARPRPGRTPSFGSNPLARGSLEVAKTAKVPERWKTFVKLPARRPGRVEGLYPRRSLSSPLV